MQGAKDEMKVEINRRADNTIFYALNYMVVRKKVSKETIDIDKYFYISFDLT